jgi:phosphoserine phosphatase
MRMRRIDTENAVKPYTPEEFHAAVLATEPRTAVFDCDGTLWAPDAGLGFMLWSLEHGMVSRERRAAIEDRYRLYEAGEVDEAAICGEMVQLYAGLREAAVEEAARAYIQARIVPTIFPAMATLVDALRDAGTELWAVSSTNRWVIEAGVWAGGRSGFLIPRERILAVEVAVEGGMITDRLLAVPTDDAKAEALVKAGLPCPDAVFGNSIHDAAMLAIARHPFPVNPNAGLLPIAAERGWRCFEPLAHDCM